MTDDHAVAAIAPGTATAPGTAHPGAPVTHARRTTAAAGASVTALSLAGVVLTVMALDDLVTSDKFSNVAASPAAVLYATLGVIVIRRVGNVIGWLLLVVGGGLAIMVSASAYAVLGVTHPGMLPAPELIGLLAEWSFAPVFTPGRGATISGTLPAAHLTPASA
jgi:hypothetical protein